MASTVPAPKVVPTPPDISRVLNDPDFQNLSVDEGVHVLRTLGASPSMQTMYASAKNAIDAVTAKEVARSAPAPSVLEGARKLASTDQTTFRRNEDVPGEGLDALLPPKPGATGGPPTRASSLELPAAVATGPALSLLPSAARAVALPVLGALGGVSVGGNAAKTVGLPPWTGALPGAVAGAVLPSAGLSGRAGPIVKALASFFTKAAPEAGGAAAAGGEAGLSSGATSAIEEVLTQAGVAPEKAKAFISTLLEASPEAGPPADLTQKGMEAAVRTATGGPSTPVSAVARALPSVGGPAARISPLAPGGRGAAPTEVSDISSKLASILGQTPESLAADAAERSSTAATARDAAIAKARAARPALPPSGPEAVPPSGSGSSPGLPLPPLKPTFFPPGGAAPAVGTTGASGSADSITVALISRLQGLVRMPGGASIAREFISQQDPTVQGALLKALFGSQTRM